jgi:hypothetical protein
MMSSGAFLHIFDRLTNPNFLIALVALVLVVRLNPRELFLLLLATLRRAPPDQD